MANVRRARDVHDAPVDVSDASTQKALVDGIRVGDMSAFETVYRAYRASLARLATRTTGSPELGDEVVHEVFLKIWRMRAMWDVGPSLTRYLFAMTRRAAVSVRRRQQLEGRWNTSLDDSESGEFQDSADCAIGPDGMAEARDRDEAILRVVQTLSPRSREAFLLRWREQLTHAEVAAAMGTSIKTVEKQLGLAFKALRRALRPWFLGEP